MTAVNPIRNRRAHRGMATSVHHNKWMAALGLAVVLVATVGARRSAPERITTPSNPTVAAQDEIAVLSGGCFWGLQAVYEHVKGVTGVTAGYAGGEAATATYDQVGEGSTGHAE